MKKKRSAGILVYRRSGGKAEVLLAHPGGPFWARKDNGAWTVPKGEFDDSENPLDAAKREFKEELGSSAPEGNYKELGSFKRPDGKEIFAWAVEGDFNAGHIASNEFELEWPPKSGKIQRFPEVDRAAWFEISQAIPKLHKGQSMFVERLAKELKIDLSEPASGQAQTSLF